MLKNYRSIRLVAFLSAFFVIAISAASASAQVTVTNPGNTTPGLAASYGDLASAITALNTQTAISGPVTITLNAGNPQTAPAGGYSITAILTGASAVNTVTIEGSGNTITASAALTVGALNDGIFKFIGSDFMTLQGFTMTENAANIITAAGTNTMTEWGVALLYASTTNGAQNITIQNNTIDLDRTYQNTFGIYSNSTHSATAVTTSATATTAAGGNDNIKVYTNIITDCNNGIVHVGPTAAADQNTATDIGGTTGGTGNTLTNIGTNGTFSGYANVSGTVNGILVRNSRNFNISRNSITMSNGGVTVTGTINGIQIPAASNAPTGTLTQTINNNSISVRGGNVANVLNGINLPSTSVNATTTNNINNNDFNTFGHTVAGGTGAINFIIQSGNPQAQTFNGNTFTNISVNTTGTITFYTFAPSLIATGSFSLTNNSIIVGFARTGAGSTTIWSSNASSVAGSTHAINANNFSNFTLTGASTFTGISDTDGPTGGGPTKTITGNTFNNISGTTNSISPLTVGFSTAATISGNTISNIAGGGAVTGLVLTSVNQNATQNTINTLSTTGAAAVTGISVTSATTNNVSRNKVYDLSGSNASSTVNGILVSGGTTINVFNNLVGDLRTPAANAANPLNGINITGGTTVTADFNTVYLNASSSGALFGSSAVSVSSTPTVTLRSNIFVNASTTTGAGLAAAHRRSTTTLTTYAAASNNNDFFGSTIFTDGTNTDATLGAYKTRVASRDSNSVSENPPFISTSGVSANFLHINTATPTQIESGGVTVAGITIDYDGDTRNVTTPDIGADEFTGILLDVIGPNITYSNLLNTSSTGNRVLSITVTDASGVPTAGIGLPVIYYRKGVGPFVSTQCTFVSGNNYDCTIVAGALGGVTTGDVIGYYVAAQDNANNVSVNPSAGAAGLTANPPAAATPPTTPNTYTIVGTISGTYNVGLGEAYTSLTNAGGIFEFINNNEVVGNITINITSDLSAASGTLVAETGTHPLNQFASPYTILIRPSGGARLVNGPAASTALIRLNGASRVTIDGSVSGGTDRSLTIENTSVTTPQVVRFGSIGTAPITGNTLKNCVVINGVNTSSAIVLGDTGGSAAGYFTNTSIQNNDIRKSFVGVFANAVIATGNGSGLAYTGNKVDNTGANAIRIVGLYMQGVDGGTIANNTVGNFEAVTTEGDTGIWLASGTVNTTVSGNTVTTLGMTTAGTSVVIGIRDSGGATASGNTLTGNTVTNISASSTTTGGPGVFGIETSSGGTIIEKNNVSGVNNPNTGTFGATGINVTAGNNVVIRNNFVSNVTGDMTGGAAFSTTFGIFGMRIAAGTGHQVYNNSVNLYGARAGTAASSLLTAAFCIINTSSTGMDVRNNIFANNMTGGTTSVANVSAFLPSGGTSAMNLTWNNNAYYWGSDVARAGAGQAGTTAGTNFFTTVAALAAYSSTLHVPATNDNASQGATTAPPFLFSNDLHLSPVPNTLLGAGAAVGVTTDFDNDPRPGTGPDIGADEIVQSVGGIFPAGTFYNALTANNDVLAGNVTITNTMTLSGILNTQNGGNHYVLTMGCDAGFLGAGTANYVVGTINKQYCNSGVFTYPVGTTPDNASPTDGGDKMDPSGNPSEYTPVTANVSSGTFPSSLSARVFDNTLNGFNPAQSLSRNWLLLETGDITANLTFFYLDGTLSDVNGAEGSYGIFRRNSNGTTDPIACAGSCVDTGANTLGPTVSVSDFSRWTGAALAPTAAGVDVSGRVLAPNGGGLRNAIVVLTDSRGVSRFARTGGFGYYQFEDVQAGETYVITVNSKKYQFTPRTLQVLDTLDDVDFVAVEEN